MKRFQSIFCATVLTLALSATALGGNISGVAAAGSITTLKPGSITTLKPGSITTLSAVEYIAVMLATMIG